MGEGLGAGAGGISRQEGAAKRAPGEGGVQKGMTGTPEVGRGGKERLEWGREVRLRWVFPSDPRSPISSLPALFDQTASAPCVGGQLDPTAPGTTNMEQLLEKQGDGEAGVNSEKGWPRAGRPALGPPDSVTLPPEVTRRRQSSASALPQP